MINCEGKQASCELYALAEVQRRAEASMGLALTPAADIVMDLKAKLLGEEHRRA